MNKSNKILNLILLINILIISVHSYSLKKYDYGQFMDIASGSEIKENFQVTKDQLLNFKLILENNDSHNVILNVTSEDLPENIIFYYTFEDEIAGEENSEKKETSTPLGWELCISSSYSFSIQMDNSVLGGDIDITIVGIPDDSRCYGPNPNSNDSEEESSSHFSSEDSSIFSSDYSSDYSYDSDDISVPSSTSRIIVDGIFIFSIVVLLFL